MEGKACPACGRVGGWTPVPGERTIIDGVPFGEEIVGLTQAFGTVFVATKRGIYRLCEDEEGGDKVFKPVRFVSSRRAGKNLASKVVFDDTGGES